MARIEGTLDSITTLLTKGRINDAYTLIRKLFDDILMEIYMDVTLKDNFLRFLTREATCRLKGDKNEILW